MTTNFDKNADKRAPIFRDDVECLILQRPMWRTGELRLTDRTTSTTRTVASLTLDVTAATPEQRPVILGVLRDKYGLDAQEKSSESLHGAPVIRVADRTPARDAARLDVLLHMADPANWRKRKDPGLPGRDEIPVLSYIARDLQDVGIANILLRTLNVSPHNFEGQDPRRISIVGYSQVRNLLERMPTLRRVKGAIPADILEPADPSGSGGASFSQARSPTEDRTQKPDPAKPAQKKRPTRADYAGTPPPEVDLKFIYEIVEPRNDASIRTPGRPYEQERAQSAQAHETVSEMLRRVREEARLKEEQDTQLEREFWLGPNARQPDFSASSKNPYQRDSTSEVATPLSYERIHQEEYRRALERRATRGDMISEYNANSSLRPEHQWRLNRLARANPDGSQDPSIERELEAKRKAHHTFRTKLDPSYKPDPSLTRKTVHEYQRDHSPGMSMGR